MNDTNQKSKVNVDYRNGKQIHIIHMNGSRREDVDAYIDAVITEVIQNPEKVLLSVQNYSKIGGMLSPYFLGRVKEFTKPDTPLHDRVGRVALVQSTDMFRILFNPVVSMFKRAVNDKLEIKFFNNLDDAIAWVEAYEIPTNLT